MKLSSPAFKPGELIPSKFSCDDENWSPPLEWEDVPPPAKSLALIVDDPDAPSGLFVHWVIFDISPGNHGLNEGTGATGTTQGTNGFGDIGYGGPCPPNGTHRYYFHLYALDAMLHLPSGVSRQELDSAMQGHILAETELMGRYARSDH